MTRCLLTPLLWWMTCAVGLGGMFGIRTPVSAQPCARVRAMSWAHTVDRVCTAHGVPRLLALAVMQTESGGHPYALRINAGHGRSLYPRTHAEAVRILQAIAPITRNIDIGLLQVNVGIWGPRFHVTAEQLLDPTTNLTIGCQILRRALTTRGSMLMRIGRYHSGKPVRQRAYARRVARWMEYLLRHTP